jgi:hypothetical protein
MAPLMAAAAKPATRLSPQGVETFREDAEDRAERAQRATLVFWSSH